MNHRDKEYQRKWEALHPEFIRLYRRQKWVERIIVILIVAFFIYLIVGNYEIANLATMRQAAL